MVKKPGKKKLISFRTDASVHRRLRMLAAEREVTIEKLATEAIEYYLEGAGR